MKKELSIKQIQDASLEILCKISSICEELNLRYYLVYGTLIGAVRHHGFIPWDDDVDIMMPRVDYEILLKYFEKNKLPYLSVFNDRNNNDYPYMITRISDDRYYIETENEKTIGMGVFIDIYPYDGLGSTLDEAVNYGMKGDRLSSFLYQSTRKHFSVKNTSSTLRKIGRFPIFLLSKILGKNYFKKRINSLQGIYNYDTSNYIGCFVWLSGGLKDIFKKEWFDDYEMCEFENHRFRIPKRYDEVLKHTYGNYMKLPPEKDRVGHHFYKAYKK